MIDSPIIALDCDGVLLDYQTTFGQIYTKTFGKQVNIVSPKAYHVSNINNHFFGQAEVTFSYFLFV
jgi:hypothetical protein